MSEAGRSDDPRWGQQGRDKKAEAILRTLELAAPDRDVRRGRWLDIGCGSGGVAATMARQVEQVVGVDPEAWDRWSELQKDQPNLDLRRGSYRDLRTLMQADSIDVVVCNQVYEHVDDPIALLAEIHRVMKPGAVCYFAGPNFWWPIEPHLHWPFAHWLPRKWVMLLIHVIKARWAYKWDARPWSYWRLANSFRREGFGYSNGIQARVRAGAADGNTILQFASKLPRTLISILTPVSPGFIFIIHKR